MKKLKAVTTIIGIIGIILMVGSAGTSDIGAIVSKQQMLLSAGCLAIAVLGQCLEVE